MKKGIRFANAPDSSLSLYLQAGCSHLAARSRNASTATCRKTLPSRDKTLQCPDKTLPSPDKTLPSPDKTLPSRNKTFSSRDTTPPSRDNIFSSRGQQNSNSQGFIPDVVRRISIVKEEKENVAWKN
jgi:hypothetical protein